LFYAYHTPVAFEVITYSLEQVKFFHSFFEFIDFFDEFAAQRCFFGHDLFCPFVVMRCFLEGLSSFVGCPREPSVIEEKGEGFENGKKYFGSFGVLSTSDFPPNYIARLKTRYSNKPCASQIN
jgi:hypothetical protein